MPQHLTTSPIALAVARRARLLLLVLAASPLWAASPSPSDYSQGVKWFPKFWRAYQAPQIPAPNLANGVRLLEMVRNGKLELSLAQLNQLVEEDSLDVLSARYNVDFAETDILRTKSGQAARGVPGVPIPGEIFSAAIGAGVGGANTFVGGGPGASAITAAARQVTIGPAGTFDPDFQVSVSYDHASSPLNTSLVAGTSTVVTPTAAVSMRFEKAFSTGFDFSVTFDSQRQSSTQQFLIYNPAYSSRLFISAYQPLLKGFGIAENRRFINLAGNNLKISRELFRQQVIQSLINAQNAYWDLVAARKTVEATQQALTTAQQLYENNRRQLQAGVMAPLDVTTAESAMAGSQRDLIVAQTDEKIKELQLKALISKSVDTLADVELVTTDPLPEPRDSDIPALQDSIKTALQNRPELREAELNIGNQKIAEKYTRNFLKPTFSLFGLYASSALYGGLGPSMQQVWVQMPFPEYAVGFSLAITLRNRSARADNARAQLELSQAETSLVREQNQVGLDVRNAVIALQQDKAQVAAAQNAVVSSKATFDAEEKKLQFGVSTPYLVIQLQRDYVAAQSQEIQAQVNYAKALGQMTQVTGTTLEKNSISLDQILRR
ncbi:MAG TPA: TolC family protein [Bryobacteraceae bacterium]|nr:TolC family protein [Bryobacteraceae bacterium]